MGHETEAGRIRRRVGYGLAGFFALCGAWIALPGIPVLWAPRASAQVKAAGEVLFVHEWRPHDGLARGGGDGLGPVFNERSCVACHSQGGVGGGGDNAHNVVTFEAHPVRDDPSVRGGLVHAFAVQNEFVERPEALKAIFPVVPGGVSVQSGCQILTRDFDRVKIEKVNSTALFGAGWIDRLSAKTIDNASVRMALSKIGRELRGDFEGITPGRPRILADGRVGKFGWKAQFATLDEFVAAACANEIGLGNPRMDQARPMGKVDYPSVAPDLDAGQFRSLVAFVDTLARPVEVTPESLAEASHAARGKALFGTVGCVACHVPDLGGVTGIYSDFLLHRLDDRTKGGGGGGYGGGREQTPEVPLPEAHPLPEEWKTPALWGVADSAPYFHDGASPTLETAILRHEGNAAPVTKAYRLLPQADRTAVVAFLKTLKAPAEAAPAPERPRTELASAREANAGR